MSGLGSGYYFVDFDIGVEVIVVMGNRILNKMPWNFEFGLSGFLIAQLAVLIFWRLFQVIFNTQLPETFQGNYD
jgi:hypothetical protein